jgi:DHA2 family multidrug resistance protein
VLERGEIEDWFSTAYILWFTVIAGAALIAFVIWELKVDHPVVNLRVLKSKTLSIAAILTFITGIGMFTSVFLTPVISQRLLGFTPSQTGLLLLPGAILAVFGLVLSGKLLQKGVSPVIIIATGFISFIYFNWRMSQMDLDTSAATITFSLIFRALGMAFLTVPLTALAVSSLQTKDIPQGAALNNMMRQLGGSFGISIINTFSTRRTAVHRVDLISNVTAANGMVTERLNRYTNYFQHQGFSLLNAQGKAVKMIELTVVKQSAMLSYIDDFLLIGLLFAIALPLLLFVSHSHKQQKAAVIISDH